jgi:hypothetical protein
MYTNGDSNGNRQIVRGRSIDPETKRAAAIGRAL